MPAMRGVPGCCTCSPPCCFNVKVQECGAALPGVTITLKLSGTTVLTGVSNGVGLVASGGIIQTHCTGSSETYDLTWDYNAVNKDRIAPASTTYSFDGSSCPTGTTTITINFAAI